MNPRGLIMPEMNNEDPPDIGSGVPRRPVRARRTRRDPIGTRGDRAELALTIFRQMLRTRALEERSIKMSKSGEAYFWIGGPGEEAFNVCLGLQIHKGFGPAFDYTPPALSQRRRHARDGHADDRPHPPTGDALRPIRTRRAATSSATTRVKEWNVVPVTSVIEVQFAMAPGTALVQKRHGLEPRRGRGDHGRGRRRGRHRGGRLRALPELDARGPGNELPVLMMRHQQPLRHLDRPATEHGEQHVADRAIPYGIRGETVDGNDPVVIWNAIDRAMRYCRRETQAVLARSDGVAAARPLVVERRAAELERGRLRSRSSSRS